MEHASTPTFAEDLLLVLFQPDSGTVAGEGVLSHVLAGAVLAELAFNGNVRVQATASGGPDVEAVEAMVPSDVILRRAWDCAAGNPGPLQPMLAAIGPALRQPLLERLVARGHLREENGKVLGMLKKTTLKDGGSGRRSDLLGDLRRTLVDGEDPTPRIAALAALLWASATLPECDPVVPWNSAVIARARELERGDWMSGDTDQAVVRATAAMIATIVASMHHQNDGPG